MQCDLHVHMSNLLILRKNAIPHFITNVLQFDTKPPITMVKL